MLLVAEGSTVRRRIGDHAPLFSHLTLRGRAAVAWLRQPQTLEGSVQPTGVLCMTKLSQAVLATVGVLDANESAKSGRIHAHAPADERSSGT